MLQAKVFIDRVLALFSPLAAALLLQLSSADTLHAQEHGWGDTWTGVRSQREREKQDLSGQVIHEVQAKQYAKAEQHIAEAAQRSPDDVRVRIWSAAAHLAMHRYDAALSDCAVAMDLMQKQEPKALGEVYLARAHVYNAMGNAKASRADFERAVHIDRGNAEFNNDLAWFLATSPDAAVRDGQLAVRYAKAANELVGTPDAGTIDTLAAAEAEAGQFDLAAKYERQALSLAKGNKLRGGDKRLRLFENHQAFREDVKNEN
ncbi:MAG TPA: tetratricopeptide repeat protein [Chthoniobacterales bacterium]|jgi:tetratricopeptide (TPR) repeat protein